MIAQLIEDIEGLAGSVRRGKAVNVNDQSTKERAIALGTQYFTSIRPALVERLGESEEVVNQDQEWQELIRLAHGGNPRRSYQRVLNQLRRSLTELNVAVLVAPIRPGKTGSVPTFSREEAAILQTLDELVPSAAASYRQAIQDLSGSDRISYRGTAAEFRESLRETLDHLAPDTEVMQQQGFALEENQTRPTMKQKVRFVLASRGRNKTQRESAERSLALIDELTGEIMRAIYNRASLATHVQGSKREVQRVKRYVDTVLVDLLEANP
jgi:predicted pPIWI-associating nuclease